MLRKVYLRYREGLPENESIFAAFAGFRMLGVETAPFEGFGDIATLEDLSPEVALTGFIGDVETALRKIGVPMPEVLDYPLSLKNWLGREVRQTILQEVREGSKETFVKPVRQKLFTGFLWDTSSASRLRLATYENSTPVWVSDPVNFLSEYRVFILDGEVLDARLYKGDWGRAVDQEIVLGAVEAFVNAPRAYALDFGVTDDDRTLLVEVNDSFSLGHYGLRSVQYARMIEARWEEMTTL